MSPFNVLGSVSSADVAQDPYPHLARSPALEPAVYRQLADEFPSQETILRGRGDKLGNAAARLPAFKVAENPNISEAWRKFFAFHTSAEFWHEILRVFAPAFRTSFPDLEKRAGKPLENWRVEQRGAKGRSELRLDCQFVVNTPAAKASSVKTAHVDKRDTILALLLYIRDPADATEGGNFEIYSWKRQPRFVLPERLILQSDIELSRVVTYAPNTLAGFVNNSASAHGVSVRSPSAMPRRYINFIAETSFDAFETEPLPLRQRIMHWPELRRMEIRALGGDRA